MKSRTAAAQKIAATIDFLSMGLDTARKSRTASLYAMAMHSQKTMKRKMAIKITTGAERLRSMYIAAKT